MKLYNIKLITNLCLKHTLLVGRLGRGVGLLWLSFIGK